MLDVVRNICILALIITMKKGRKLELERSTDLLNNAHVKQYEIMLDV